MVYVAPPTGLATMIFGGAKLIKKLMEWLTAITLALSGVTLSTKSPFFIDNIKKRLKR